MPLKRKPCDGPSYARLDTFTRGVIWGLALVGTPREEICKLVAKKDGAAPTKRAVDDVIAKKKEKPEWRGEEIHGGRPKILSEDQQQQLVDLVFAERGRAKVTVRFCKRRLKFLRRVSRQTVERALQHAGLRWLRRRPKTLVPAESKASRMEYAAWLQTRRQTTLDRFAYTDGTTFYLARSDAECADKRRLALGTHVWRMSGGKDGLWDENVGPSLYAKGQGLPVKIWGFFGNGRLEYYVLPRDGKKTTNMNGDTYEWLVGARFAQWRRACFGDDAPVHLCQDHEACLWQDRNVRALRDAGCAVVERYPKHSPDLNAIEGWWRVLRERMELTAPAELESREAFIARLRRTARWLNDNRWEDGLALCTNQKKRAADVLELQGSALAWQTPPGRATWSEKRYPIRFSAPVNASACPPKQRPPDNFGPRALAAFATPALRCKDEVVAARLDLRPLLDARGA